MPKFLIRSITGTLTLPFPYNAILAPGGAVVVSAADEQEIIANLGGLQTLRAVARISRIPEGTVVTAFSTRTPGFLGETLSIVANASGSDTTGEGTVARPFRTFQEAARRVPYPLPAGFSAEIDITDLGDEEFPANYALPAWAGSTANVFNLEFVLSPSIRIVATPRPASGLTVAQRTVNPTSVTTSPVSRTTSVQDTSQSWDAGSLKDLIATYEVDGEPFSAVIYDNTADTIFLCGNDSQPVAPVIGEVLTIKEHSARFITTNEQFGFSGGFNIVNTCNLFIHGVNFDTAPESFTSLYCFGTPVWFENCRFVQPYFDTSPRQYYTVKCSMAEPVFESIMYIAGTSIRDGGIRPFQRQGNVGLMIHSGSVLDNTCVQIGDGLIGGVDVGTSLSMSNVLIKNAPADAVKLIGGTSTISCVEVIDAAGNALYFHGPGRHFIKAITGTGNGGVGVSVDDGAQVEALTQNGTGDSLEFFPEYASVVLTDAGANFEKYIDNSEGPRVITITGSTSPANDGTFIVIAVFDANNMAYRNPSGVTEAFGAGTWTIDPVTVTGSDNQQVGDLGPAAYPSLPFNLVDWTYDPTAGAPTQVTGTGGRFFNS